MADMSCRHSRMPVAEISAPTRKSSRDCQPQAFQTIGDPINAAMPVLRIDRLSTARRS